MIVWVKEHPILASLSGLMIIVLLYLLLHRGGGSSQQQVSANPGGVSDSAYTAQLAAGVQSQQVAGAVQAQNNETAAAIALGLASADSMNRQTQAARDIALQQTLTGGEVANYSAAANLSAVSGGYNRDVAVASLNTGAAVSIAGIQADVAKDTSSKQLALGLDSNKTALGLANFDYSKTVNTNSTAAQIAFNNNITAEHIVNTEAQTSQLNTILGNQTQQLEIATQGRVLDNQTAASLQLNSTQLQDAFSLAQQAQSDKTSLTVGVSQYGGNYSNAQLAALQVVQNTNAGTAVGVGNEQESASKFSALWQGISSIVSSVASGTVGVAKAVN